MIPSPNRSSREGRRVIWVVIHTAEGALDVGSLGNYFSHSSVQASSHVGIDDHRIERYVLYADASWTLRGGNTRSDNAELCGFAAWTRAQWLGEHRQMLELAAGWIRERCQARGIPMVKLSPADVAAGRPGVIGHHDYTLGAKDGTHTDPGPGFPWDIVMALANQQTAPTGGDDDLTPEQAAQLALLTSQLVTGQDPAKAWGWPTLPGGTGEVLTVVDYLRRANTRLEDLHRRLAAVETGKAGGPGSLSEGDVARIADRVVKLLGAKTSA